jgi:HD-GYP domain-containing protein (c-di-GMP phosphodiesterase class II)
MDGETAPSGGGLLSLWHRHPLRVHIATVFLALLLVACGVIAWTNYHQGRRIVLSSAEDLFGQIEQRSTGDIERLRAPVATVVDLLSRSQLVDADTFAARMAGLGRLVAALNRHEGIAAVYVGYYNGDFFLLRALRDEQTRKAFEAPRHAAFLVQSMERRGGGRRPRYVLLDAALNTISESAPAEYAFDPRTRPWFRAAMKDTELVQTEPYVFFTTQVAGETLARRADHGRAVVGADLTLENMSAALARSRATPSTQLAIFDSKGNVIAYSDPGKLVTPVSGGALALARISELSPVMAMAADSAAGDSGTMRTIEVEGRSWLVKTARIGPGDSLASAVPLDELLTEARANLQRSLWLSLLIVALAAPLTWWVAHRIAANLDALTAFAAAIRQFRFDARLKVRTRIIEIAELGSAMRQMRDTIRNFLDITMALSAERKFDRLLQRVLEETRDAAGGSGGVIYLLEEDGKVLKPAAQVWDAGDSAALDTIVAVPADDGSHPVTEAARPTATTLARTLAPGTTRGLEYLDARFGRSAVGLVTLPLRSRAGEAIGVLCVFLRDDAALPSPERLALVEAFAGAGAVAIDNQRLLLAQKALLDAFIGLTAGAIDAKSPYTGGHCQRVPELTFMLTRAVCDWKEGPHADFNLSEEEWEALHIAGWLHDCGKVTTPEYVVDKATKLETIYDRIHEIRMRFEVLKRDAEIACLKAVAAGGDERELRAALEREQRALDEEFAFIATCNIGGEFMAPEKVQRLKEIAGRTWQRTLDSRLGVSWEEAKRFERAPAAQLPVTEQLLADKPEHIIDRGPQDLMPPDNPWGFKLKVPAHRYNRGELYNLSIARGTLTEEERYKINDHIVQTIIMLSQLPFPRHLKQVPELAGGHHEKMDGTGYPKRLTREQMSVPARVMAIADIFEALTAVDRPYKKGKTLSEAVKIMSFMKKDRHIDPDLFDIFLKSGVYHDYAKRFMQPQYIDEVDIKAYT